MHPKHTRWAGEGLERSCLGTVAGWVTSTRLVGGVELFSAWFAGEAYQKHRHDAYAVGVTDSGVQVFDYRGSVHVSRRVDVRALERARLFLDAEKTRVVRSTELESITGLTRYELSRQFRIMFGTSPYRNLLMRRLDFARERIHRDRPLVEVACDAGFADQAHFTRAFRSAFGLTPAHYRAMLRTGRTRQSREARQRADPLLTSTASATDRC